MANECVPFFDSADHVTVVVGSTGVWGKRFVSTVGPLAVGSGLAGGAVTGVLPAAGQVVLGVAAEDGLIPPANVMVYTTGMVPVEAAAALTAGTLVMSDATGAAVPWDGTIGHAPAGFCCGDTASGNDAPVMLR